MTTYAYMRLDVPGATVTNAGGINNAGQVVGNYAGADGKSFGFLYAGGAYSPITVPNTAYTDATDINASGVIAGDYPPVAGSLQKGFTLTGGVVRTLSPLNSLDVFVRGINDAGTVVGSYTAGGTTHGFFTAAFGYATLDVPGAVTTYAEGINNAGVIVGSDVVGAASRGFSYAGGAYTAVIVPGGSTTDATGINTAGEITGYYGTSGGIYAGFVDRGGVFETLVVPGAGRTLPGDINDAGIVVGGYADANSVFHGFEAVPGGLTATFTSPGGTTSHAFPQLNGTGTPGATITIRDFGNAVAGTTVNPDGTWLARVGIGADGAHSYVARTTDSFGDIGDSAALTLTLDSKPNQGSFGTITHDGHSAGGEVYALYDGLLGRVPDAIGLEYWAGKFATGTPIDALAGAFLGSPEGVAHFGAASNGGFVAQLYQSTLHRAADAGGLAYWTSQLDGGATRAHLAGLFSVSDEHLANLAPVFNAGVFVPDGATAQVARLYYAVLGRAPEAGGLAYWSAKVAAGAPVGDVAGAFLGTQEVQSRLGGLSDHDYVDSVFVSTLGRHPDEGGAAFWEGKLGAGASRAEVATAVGESGEAATHLVPLIESGWHLF